MKLSLSRVSILLQFLATLVADDDGIASRIPSNGTLQAAMSEASLNGKTERSLDNSENDVDIDSRIPTRAQHAEHDNGINAGGTKGIHTETAAEVLHDDSLTSMPSIIPVELMDLGRKQSDHIEVVVSPDSADDQIKYTGTRTRTDASRGQIERETNSAGEHERINKSGDTVEEQLRVEIDQSIEVIPETSDEDESLNIDETSNEIENDRETESQIEQEGDTDLNEDNVVDDGEDDDEKPPNEVSVDYAKKSTGAIILDKSPDFKGTNNLLLGNNDRYAISPCEGHGVKYVIIGLSEDIEVNTIRLSSYERYSSLTKKFEVLGSTTYPISSEWEKLGTFEAKPWFKENGEQTFELERPSWCRYLKFRFISHYGVEHYCTLTEVKVYGSTTQQGFHMQWDARDEEEENTEERDEIVKPMQVDTTVGEKELDDTEAEIEAHNRIGDIESTLRNKGVIDVENHDAEEYGSKYNIRTGTIEEQSLKEGHAGGSNDLADIASKNNKNEVLQPGTTTADPLIPEGKSIVEENGENEGKIIEETTKKNDSSFTDNTTSQTENLTKKDELNTSSMGSHGLESKDSSGRPTMGHGQNSIDSRLLEHVLSNNPFISKSHNECSALDYASIKTASSKFVEEKTNSSALESHISLEQDSSIMPPSVTNIQNLIKTKISSGKDATTEEKHDVIDPLLHGVSSKFSKVVKDAIDTMNFMNMKGTPSLSGLLDMINSKLIPEAFQDNIPIKMKTRHDAADSEIINDITIEFIPEESPTDHKDSSPARKVPLPDSLSSGVELKPETNLSRDTFIKSISDQACLDELDFQGFKSRLLKSGGAGSVIGNGGAGGSKNEPIFKKLTDEIKVLQTSQGIHDQYVEAVTSCYGKVIVDMHEEIVTLKAEHEERLLSIEEKIRLLGRKHDEIVQNGMMTAFVKSLHAYSCLALKVLFQWISPAFSTMIDIFLILKTHLHESETVQQILRFINAHIGEIYAFLAGSIFCFLVTSIIWWFYDRKGAIGNSKSIHMRDTVNVKESHMAVNVKEEPYAKRKRKKSRRDRKTKLKQLVCTDYSESSLGSINLNSSFG